MLAILLLDENTSPRIVRALWERQVDAVHIRDRGLLGASDHELWKFAKQEARTIVTINGKDFDKQWKEEVDFDHFKPMAGDKDFLQKLFPNGVPQ